jgi:hypothetical protein
MSSVASGVVSGAHEYVPIRHQYKPVLSRAVTTNLVWGRLASLPSTKRTPGLVIQYNTIRSFLGFKHYFSTSSDRQRIQNRDFYIATKTFFSFGGFQTVNPF